MRKLILIGATVIGATVLFGLAIFSERVWSVGRLSPQHKLSVSIDTANAVIGRPLTPGVLPAFTEESLSARSLRRRILWPRCRSCCRRSHRQLEHTAPINTTIITRARALTSQGPGRLLSGPETLIPRARAITTQAQESTTESARTACAARFRSYNAETGMYLGYPTGLIIPARDAIVRTLALRLKSPASGERLSAS